MQRLVRERGGSQCDWGLEKEEEQEETRRELRGRQQPGSPEAFGTGRIWDFLSMQWGNASHLFFLSHQTILFSLGLPYLN